MFNAGRTQQGAPSQSGSWLAALHLRATPTLPAHVRDGGAQRRCGALMSQPGLPEHDLRHERLMDTTHPKDTCMERAVIPADQPAPPAEYSRAARNPLIQEQARLGPLVRLHVSNGCPHAVQSAQCKHVMSWHNTLMTSSSRMHRGAQRHGAFSSACAFCMAELLPMAYYFRCVMGHVQAPIKPLRSGSGRRFSPRTSSARYLIVIAKLMLQLLLLLCVLQPQEGLALGSVDVTPDYKRLGASSGNSGLGCGCFARESADVFLTYGSTTAVPSSCSAHLR